MGFKADTSFLKYLSMGAIGARQTMAQMREEGFEPIELERYCATNKIWSTKVKRFRLPDILCIRTGLRVEVRAKSDLKIKMSDAPNNKERRWNAGLRDDDLIAFIACVDDHGTPRPAKKATFFAMSDLRRTEKSSQLGPPKSASEGAERDRTWPCIVPSRDGVVQSVDREQICVLMDADGERHARLQTYNLRGKVAYVDVGERFAAEASILAGSPRRRMHLSSFARNVYEPLNEINARHPVDRYAAAKSLPYRERGRRAGLRVIEERLDVEQEDRVLLEAVGAGAAMGSAKATERLEAFLWEQERADLRMEAVFILSELRAPVARDILLRVAGADRFEGEEIRQAAVWGLGKAGLKSYADLVPFLGDEDRDVVLHAIAAFGPDTSDAVIDRLIGALVEGDPKRAPAASEALRNIGSTAALRRLVAAARGRKDGDGWVLATLGRFPADRVRAALRGEALIERLAPLLLLSSDSNWLAVDTVDIDLKFLLKQNL